jgi:pyruvate/2-oxoglutarate dehydrogenase complex dihydrolipoamide dehydrogenase (E3) component
MNQNFDIIIVGGGAAGYSNQYCRENPKLKVAILERGADVLQKVVFWWRTL